jgi:Rod binding domain-containing protein
VTTPIDNAALPAEVRASGANGRKLYEATLGFESVLLQTIAQSLNESTTEDGTGDEGSDATSSLTSQLVPDALAQSVSGSGGTGLALELWRAMKGPGS